ncbi:metal ABC transporter permease [Bacillus tianshenii]|nr:metal ABC transporter permease [Bacillus tianshenii]
MLQEMLAMLGNANTQWVLAGTLLLGISSGVLGSFALLRKQSLIGDAMAHAALPGVCLAFILYGKKSMPLFLIGAALAGLLATYFIQAIAKHSRIKEDTSIGLVLSVFFGFGIVLLTRITQSSSGNKSGLDDFIFGQAASLVGNDVKVIAGAAACLLLLTALLFKEFKLLSFDPAFAQGIGMPVKWFNGLLMTLIVGAVVIGIQAVGVVLMSAMLITPAIAARYWTEKLSVMVILSGAIGGVAGVSGTLLSTVAEGLATGPIIVIAATIIFLFSLLFAPKRGLLIKTIKHLRMKRQTAKEYVLISLYELYEEAGNNGKMSFTTEHINAKRPVSSILLKSAIRKLSKRGFIQLTENDGIQLSSSGLKQAHQHTLQYRLQEIYLMHEKEFAVPEVEDIRTDYEKLPSHLKSQLKEKLSQYNREPLLLRSDNEGYLLNERKVQA